MTPLILFMSAIWEGSDFCVMCLVGVYVVTVIENQTPSSKILTPRPWRMPVTKTPQLPKFNNSVCCGRRGYDVSHESSADRQYHCLSDGRMMAWEGAAGTTEVVTEMMALASFCPMCCGCRVMCCGCLGGEGVSFLPWFRLVLVDECKVSVFAIMAGFWSHMNGIWYSSVWIHSMRLALKLTT